MRPRTELILMMRPSPRWRIDANMALAARIVPNTLTSNRAFTWLMEDSSAPPNSPRPALLTSTSMRPVCESTAETRALTDASSVTSQYHPLREILDEQIDFEELRRSSAVKLFVCASNIMTNRLRVFERQDICADAVLASACLPHVFQAIEIEGQHYWDGGYMGNPPIFPLIYDCASPDVILVLITPIRIAEVPKSAQAILDRILDTLSFNSSLMREMRQSRL